VALLGLMHQHASMDRAFAAAGGPWEFNLRDLLRWCELAAAAAEAAPAAGGAAGGSAMDVEMADGSAAAEAEPVGEAGWEARLQAAALHYARMLFAQRLRTAGDRRHVEDLLARVFGPEAAVGGSGAAPRPSLLLSPELLVAGQARVARAGGGGGGGEVSEAAGRAAPELALLPAQLPLLESMAQCVQRGWMCLLVGPGAAGKTSAARCLAALCGRRLLEVPMTNGGAPAAPPPPSPPPLPLHSPCPHAPPLPHRIDPHPLLPPYRHGHVGPAGQL
jgi:midasin